MSRRIRLRHVNALLFAVIALLTVVYARELRWAAAELPGYLEGVFSETPERQLYLEAERILREGRDIDRALPLLEKSLDIDPRGEAGFWLGLYHEMSGDGERALEAYTRYLQTDPVLLQTYLQMAGIHQRQGRSKDARDALQRGLSYFEANAEHYRPFVDRTASPDHNDKARQAYARYRTAINTLREALASLEDERAAE